MAKEPAKEESKPRTFADMVAIPSLGTLLSDRAFETETDNAEGFNMPFIMGPIFDVIRNESTRTPLTIGIYGGWGTGKTSAMEWLHGIIRASNETKEPETKIIPVWFYPWKYQTKDDVWRGIIAEVILATLDKTTLMEAGNADMLKAEGREVILDAAKRFGPALGKTFCSALGKIALKGSVKVAGAEVSLEGTNLKQIIDDLTKNLNPERNYLNSFENDLNEWVKKHVEEGERIVLFIDDLDRCLPEVTLQVLEALKLYLKIPNLIFVVGIDKDVVEQIVIKHYDTQGVTKEKAEQYLAKMFQIEVQVGPTEKEIGDYFEQTVASMDIWKQINPEYQDVLSNTIKSIAKRNPREIKRVANAALLGGMGAKWNQAEDENAIAIGIMIYLLKSLLPKTLRDMIGNTAGDEFLYEVSTIVQDGNGHLLHQLGENAVNQKVTTKDSTQRVSLPSELPQLDQPQWRNFLAIFECIEVKLILDLLIVPYPKESGRFSLTPPQEEDDIQIALRENPNPTILSLIYSNISNRSLLRLKSLTNLTTLDLEGTQITDAGIAHLQSLTTLTRLDLDGTQITDSGLAHLKSFPNLTTLSLYDTQITDSGLVHLKSLPNLTAFYVGGTQISSSGLAHLKYLTNLSELFLNNTRIADDGLAHLKSLSKLSKLFLNYTPITDDGLAHLKSLANLTTLSLSSTQITDDGLAHLKSLTNLTTLYLGGTQITDSGLAHLKSLTNLTTLYLGSTQITDSGLAHLKSLTKLTGLDLSSTQITDTDFAHLKSLTNLTRLDLSNTHITDTDLAHLKSLTNLTSLDLRSTQITDNILAQLKSLTKLTALFLHRTQVSNNAIEEIKNSIPGLLVYK